MADLKDSKLLVIVESPNKVKTISGILKKAGYKHAVVSASVGHIATLADKRDSWKNSGVYPEKDFALNIQIAPDKEKVVSELKTYVKNADYVYIMSDGDREGEKICDTLITFLKIPKTKCRRAITHEITPKAVLHAIENPIKVNEKLIEAADARLAIDKLIGYGLSPVARTYIGAKSVGRCQSAGLKLIVDREHEIINFKPEQYFDIYLKFSKNNTKFKAKYVGTDKEPIDHLKNIDDVNAVKAGCTDKFIVKNISKKEKQESPKPPFCTATFQQEAASKLGLKIKDAMSCAQKLFEGINVGGEHIGLITYMRTDSTDLAEEFVPELKNYITTNYGANSFVTPRVGKKTGDEQEGHEALRIVDPNMTPEKLAQWLPNDLYVKVYRLIWQRTIAAALPNAIISETTYNIYNNIYKFNLISNEVISPGYKAVYSYKDDDSKEEQLVKETFKENEVLADTSLEDVEKTTTPPARYTEASLVNTLRKTGIGRPSTFATIVETVLSPVRNYATLEGKSIVPTDKGMQLAAFLDRSFSNIINLDYTRQMEESLDAIAEGKLDKLSFLKDFFNDLTTAISTNTEMPIDGEAKICSKCGAPMVVRRSRFGKLFYGCSNYPKCTSIENFN